jgi:uncharacterized protein (TIGR03790 family)
MTDLDEKKGPMRRSDPRARLSATLACGFLSLLPSLAQTPALPPRNPGQETVVVYNSRVPESRGIAEHFALMRKVPIAQVVGLSLSSEDDISRQEFRDSLQQPLANFLADKKLWKMGPRAIPASTNEPAHTITNVLSSSVRYLVLCYGVPLRIAEDSNYKEAATEKLRPEMRRNIAAVDSELALLPDIHENLPIGGPLRNLMYGMTNAQSFNPTNGILMVARLDGPTPAIARALVDKAMEAETNGLWGRAYFDTRGITDANYKIGDEWIGHAAEICRKLGFETVMDTNADVFPAGFPMSQIAIYIGWYTEHVAGALAQPTVEFMPGAFAYHLHSFSALTLRTTTRHWVGPLLAKGCTATMGCVTEPYLTGTPDMTVFTGRFVYEGFSFGEAAYSCQPVLSWQTTVVGDPLYHPFANNAEQLHRRLEETHSPWSQWSYLRLVDLNLAVGKKPYDVAPLLENLELTKHSAVLTEKLADLYILEGKPSSAVATYEEALKRGPSPQQKLRLLLTLGDKQTTAGRDEDALKSYRQIVRAFPDYPDKIGVYGKLLTLARKLNHVSEISEYETEIKRLSGQ